ncbi:putative RING-type zinc-finger [Lyophyllum shimeji]|uniref:RING-type zinc-finger n=1 Tax=Lyophyllum shimeji TaxID=47721 RepID=A0A9P3PTC3_LYOSH|nr:putative RING-type zinc-finger [Lyophyllum shimeji]
MPLCGICIEDLDTPVSLPCGHLFCSECIARAVDAVSPYSTLHSCPVCRSTYSVAAVDPALIPANLRSHVLPSIRRIYPDFSGQTPRTISGPTEIAMENSRLHAENAALRTACVMWRRRAEIHGAAIVGLTGFARTARDEAIKMRCERDAVYKHYNLLREKLPASELSLHPCLTPPSNYGEPHILPQTSYEIPQPPSTEIAPPASLSRRPLKNTSPVDSKSPSMAEKELPRPAKRARHADPV